MTLNQVEAALSGHNRGPLFRAPLKVNTHEQFDHVDRLGRGRGGSLKSEDEELVLTSVTLNVLHRNGVDPLSDADGTHKLGCHLEGLDPERQMTDSLVVMTLNLSRIPCASMRRGRTGLQLGTSLKVGPEQGDADEKSASAPTDGPESRESGTNNWLTTRCSTWCWLLFSEQCLSGAQSPTICPTDTGGGQNSFKEFLIANLSWPAGRVC